MTKAIKYALCRFLLCDILPLKSLIRSLQKNVFKIINQFFMMNHISQGYLLTCYMDNFGIVSNEVNGFFFEVTCWIDQCNFVEFLVILFLN